MPATTSSYIIGSAGLVGFLPLGGFFALAQGIDLLSVRSIPFMAIFLITNSLTALNLVRVFRHVFLGNSLIKSRRSAEVNWQMALPMVSLSVIVLIMPILLIRIESLEGLFGFPIWTTFLVVLSGFLGLISGAILPLSKAWSRSLNPWTRWFQDLLAYDFYTERFYQLAIVNVVAKISYFADLFDRKIVDGILHGVASISLQSADNLKLSISGKSQTYLLTFIIAIIIFLASISWFL